ncbi:hypothetical protein DPEC_G00346750 [Dallia pectoralis]|uniref:Uncharacterized protein n=1 Tax=Dallia pectoralis TaxID=75939 RepID=A0ACC2F3U9_DALPE|nr:hypothetical protein DPEC_G00346750 [Dallia pectoralis]
MELLIDTPGWTQWGVPGTRRTNAWLSVLLPGCQPVHAASAELQRAGGQIGRQRAPTTLLVGTGLARKTSDSGERARVKEDPPHICKKERREWGAESIGCARTCVRLAPCENVLASTSTLPLLPLSEHMVCRQRHLAALTLSSCALSSPVGTLGTATSSTTCGSSRA